MEHGVVTSDHLQVFESQGAIRWILEMYVSFHFLHNAAVQFCHARMEGASEGNCFPNWRQFASIPLT